MATVPRKLIHADDSEPGITRRKSGRAWAYFGPDGERITDRDEIDRLNKIGLPPAYTNAWFCPDPGGHIQAVGWDEKGRKQYRYHTGFREAQEAAKYDRCAGFGEHPVPSGLSYLRLARQRPRYGFDAQSGDGSDVLHARTDRSARLPRLVGRHPRHPLLQPNTRWPATWCRHDRCDDVSRPRNGSPPDSLRKPRRPSPAGSTGSNATGGSERRRTCPGHRAPPTNTEQPVIPRH